MNPIELMDGFIKRLKDAEKQLSSLEKKAQKLADKQSEINEHQASIRADIAKHEQAISTLEQEDAGLKNRILEAMLSDDAATESTLKRRRKEIATETRQHHKEIRGLRESLESLEDTDVASAELAAKLDMLNFGSGWFFGTQLRNVLVSNERELKSRQSAARRQLPNYSQEVYTEVRGHLDEEYAARQERDGMSQVEYDRFQKRKAEREKKDEAANTPFIGVGAFGGTRRTEPGPQDFSS